MEDDVLLKELDKRFETAQTNVAVQVADVRKDIGILREANSKEFGLLRKDVEGLRKDIDGVKAEVAGVRKGLETLRETTSKEFGLLRKDVEGLRVEIGGVKSEVAGVRKDLDTLRETTSKEFSLLRELISTHISALQKVIDSKPDLNMVAKLAWIIVGSVIAGVTLVLTALRAFNVL